MSTIAMLEADRRQLLERAEAALAEAQVERNKAAASADAWMERAKQAEKNYADADEARKDTVNIYRETHAALEAAEKLLRERPSRDWNGNAFWMVAYVAWSGAVDTYFAEADGGNT